MKTQNTNNSALNTIVNLLGYVFLAGATFSLGYTIYTFVNLIF